jgi:hypothetical protein
VRLYSNLQVGSVRLAGLLRVALSHGRVTREPVARIQQRVSRRLEPEMIQRIVAEYQRGTSSTRLTVRYGIGKGTVLRLLRQHGVSLRHRGVPKRANDERRARQSEG